jgi:glycosyltransferase involved in cell wall biosynthesis
VYDIHDLYFSFVELKGLPNLASRTIRWIESTLIRFADYVLVACRAIGGQSAGILDYYAANSRNRARRPMMEVLWNYPLAHGTAIEARRSKKFTIGYIGPLRNCDVYLLSIMDSLRAYRHQLTLLFVDYGSEIDKFKKMAASHYADFDIRFLPRLPYREAKKYFLMSDVVILSLYPAFALKSKTQRHTVNMKYFEAASLGIPCIAWAHTLSADFVQRYGNGFVYDGTIDMADIFKHFGAVKARAETLQNEFLWDRQNEVIARAVGVAV